MTDKEQTELGRLFRQMPAPRSPEHLDEAILGAANSMAPRRRPSRTSGWMTVLATACIAAVAVVVIDPLQFGRVEAPAPALHRPAPPDAEEAQPMPASPALEMTQPAPAPQASDLADTTTLRFNGGRSQAPPSRVQPDSVIQGFPTLTTPKKLESEPEPEPGRQDSASRLRSKLESRALGAAQPMESAIQPDAESAELLTPRAESGRLQPCSADWMHHVADLAGLADTDESIPAMGSPAWRERIAEQLRVGVAVADQTAELEAWCEWLDSALQQR